MYHSSIKRAPEDVFPMNQSDASTEYGSAYIEAWNIKRKHCIFEMGDTVHVSKHKLIFEKGYETNWTEELFVLTKCVPGSHVYRVKDLLDEPI